MRILLLPALVFGAIGPVAAQPAATDAAAAKVAAAKAAAANSEAVMNAVRVDRMNAIKSSGINNDIVSFDNREHAVRGTPFLIPAWLKGAVMPTTGAPPMVGYLKFDVAAQEIWLRRPQGDSIILNSAGIKGFVLAGNGGDKLQERYFERLPTGLIPGAPVAYAEALTAGNTLRMLRFRRKTFTKEASSSGYNVTPAVDLFNNQTQYYLRWSDGSYVAVKPTKSSILSAIKERQPALAATIAKDKAKPRTDAELSEMVAQLNSALTKP